MLCHSDGVTEQSRAATGEGAEVDDDPEAGSESPPPSSPTLSELLDEAPTSRFHRRAVVISGMGFFTDAYDLFVISTVATLVTTQWHLSTTAKSWVSGAAILGAFFGALVFGRI